MCWPLINIPSEKCPGYKDTAKKIRCSERYRHDRVKPTGSPTSPGKIEPVLRGDSI